MPIYKGNNQIVKVYQGEQEIDKVYRGASKVYGADKGTEITVSGNPLVLTNVAKESALDTLEIMGRTEQVQLQGYNLWQQEWLPSRTLNGITLTNNSDGSYTLNGTCTASSNFEYTIELKAGTYVLKANSNFAINNSSYLVQVYSFVLGTGNGVYNINGVSGYATFNFSSDTRAVARIRIQQDITYDNLVIRPQLEKGTVAHSYEPYCGGIPSPNPAYPQEIVNVNSLEVVNSGKNLLDIDSMISGYVLTNGRIGTSDANNLVSDYILLDAGTYTYSIVHNSTNGLGNWIGVGIYDLNKNFIERKTWNNNKTTFTLVEKRYIRIGSRHTDVNGKQANPPTYVEVQLEAGTLATQYEPYKPIHIATIDGIELTKWDKIVKRNGVWGVSKWSNDVLFDGNPNQLWYANHNPTSQGVGWFFRQQTTPNIYEQKDSNTKAEVYCDKYIALTQGEYWLRKQGILRYMGNSYGLCVYSNDTSLNTIDKVNEFLTNNPLSVTYRTNAEVSFTPLSQTIQDQLNALQIYKPTTIVTNNAECEMSASYLCYLDNAEAMLTNLYNNDLSEVLK